MFLFDPGFASDFSKVEREVGRIMERAQAEIIMCRKWDERKLAYEIKGRKRGCYVLTFFQVQSDNLAGIERDAQLSESILRALVLKADYMTEEDMQAACGGRAEPDVARSAVVAETKDSAAAQGADAGAERGPSDPEPSAANAEDDSPGPTPSAPATMAPSAEQPAEPANLTRDPELSYTPSNTPLCKFGMAINRKWRDQQGDMQEQTCFVDCTAFGRQAETINQYMSKGRPILIEGRLDYSQWTNQEGQKRSKLAVVVERSQFLGGRPADGGERAVPAAAEQADAPPQSSGMPPSGGDFPPPSAEGEGDIPF
jgi:single-strand DNA-binding protein